MLTWLRTPRRASRRRLKPITLTAERLEDRSVPSATLIKDINQNTAGSDPTTGAELNGRLYFFANDGVHGGELWSMDGNGQAELVKDINPGPNGSAGGFELLRAGSRLFFTADDGVHGLELWTTDGTSDGTHLVKDIDPAGPVETMPGWVTANAQFLTELNGGVAFLARDSVHGQELWYSDGTEAGTYLVKDINPAPGADLGAATNSYGVMYFNFLQKAGDEVFFVANDGVHGVELWASDGTEAGTHLVKDLNTLPGATAEENAGSFPYYRATLGDRLHFDAWYGKGNDFDGPLTGSFSTDGTAAGTVRHPFWITGGAMLDGKPVFGAGDDKHGIELWAGDASLIKEIEPGEYGPGMPMGSDPASFVELNGALYFQAHAGDNYQLWKTDGTVEGTALVTNLGAKDPGDFFNPLTLTVLNGTLLIHGETADGWQLWGSDGTAAGTTLLAHLADGDFGNWVHPTGAAGGTYYLLVSANVGAAMKPERSTQLWATDGTIEGTRELREFRTANAGGSFAVSATVGDAWFFTTDDGEHGMEWWASDGTVEGTRLAADVNAATLDSSPADFVTIGGHTYFSATIESGRLGLYRTDGTTEGTTLVADLPSTPSFWGEPPRPRELTEFDGALYFSYEGRVWKADGALAAPFAGPGGEVSADANSGDIAVAGDSLYFFSYGSNSATLWVSDGTAGGSAAIHTFEANVNYIGGPVQIGERVGVGGTLFFVASDVAHGAELWKSDGTPEGTVRVTDINPASFDYTDFASGGTVTVGNSSEIRGLVALGDSALFVANDGEHGPQLWASDGTEAGTTPLMQDVGASAGVVIGGKLFFDAYDKEHGMEPWVSDGTVGGTHLLKDIQPKPEAGPDDEVFGTNDGSWAMGFTAVGDAVYFAAYDSAHSLELWKTDGTEAGTVLVKDIIPGGGSLMSSDPMEAGASLPHNLMAVGDTLYFLATDKYGTEIWMSDGTAEGTTLALDVVPGPKSEFDGWGFGPKQLGAAGDKLVFAASDAAHGRELWGIDVAELPEAPLPLPDDDSDTTLPGGGKSDDPPVDVTDIDPPIQTVGGVVVSAGAGYVVTEGDLVQFDAEVAGRDDAVMLRYTWDIDNDGEFDDAKGMSPTLVGNQLRALGLFGGPESHTVRVRAEQRDGTEVGIGTAELTILDAPLVTSGSAFEVTEGQAFNRNLVTFKDPGGFEDITHYAATIDWADGTTSNGTVIRDGSQFRVSGEHAYAQNGAYQVTVAISDDGGPAQYATAEVTVRDAGLYANRTFVRPTAGRVFNGSVASFRDRNPLAVTGGYTATIEWGDGSMSDATFAGSASGGWDVLGAHTYAAAGDYLIRVTIHDGAASTTVVSNAKVGAGAIVARGAASTAMVGQESSLTLATFRDADRAATASLFSATIDWTDGSISAGLVEADGTGGFTVKGSHAFATAGTKRPVVTIQDATGLSASAAARVQVTEA